ncbi:MAG: glycosyltransferase family 2 protein [Magnetococcales bacterium]|nr:glycosyltransferase family 2 protein [Magnetococcales bacterium]
MSRIPTKKTISIVLPVYDEEKNLQPLYEQLVAVLQTMDVTYEIIFVDDGSRDGSFEIIQKLHQEKPQVKAIQLRKHSGKGMAYVAGFEQAEGEIIVTLDSDLQDDPKDLPALLAHLQSETDVVIGWKTTGKGHWFRSLASRLFNRVVSGLAGISLHDVNSPFRVFRRQVLEEIEIQGDQFRFIPILAASRGFSVVEVPIHNRPRCHGNSKFGAARYYRGLLDLITVLFLIRFSQRPLHFFGVSGLLCGLSGFFILLFFSLAHLFHIQGFLLDSSWNLHNRPLLSLGILLIIVGIQLVSMGLLGELIISRDQTIRHRPPIRRKLPES